VNVGDFVESRSRSGCNCGEYYKKAVLSRGESENRAMPL